MAPPPGSRATRPVLAPGDLLAGRYRLVRPVDAATPGEEGPADLWLAHDDVLARHVAAKVLSAGGRRGAAAARPFLEAAAAAGALASPVLARVYDAAIEQRPAERAGRPVGEIDVAYVISEWVDGRRLSQVLAEEGPYEPAEAVALVTAVAEALAVAHARGVAHGRVHPGNLLVDRGGGVRLTDLAVSAALPDRAAPAARSGDPQGTEADVRDLAAVLYALLTGRWPDAATPQPAGGLPAAPAVRTGSDKRGRLTSPRQVRAGVPRALDDVVVRALDPAATRAVPAASSPAPAPARRTARLTTVEGLVDALEKAVRADTPRSAPVARTAPRVPPWVRRRLPAVVVVLALSALGLSAYAVGRSIGTVPTPEDQAAALASPSPRGPASGTRIDLTRVPVRDFDPAGDRRERPGSVANAHDDDLSTVWETERYERADFSGRKPGVGLVVDLGAPTPVSRVEVLLAAPGVTVELRATATATDDLEPFRVLTRGRADGDRLVLTPPAGTRARYYLVWVTGLAPDDGRFAAGVRELLFTRGAA